MKKEATAEVEAGWCAGANLNLIKISVEVSKGQEERKENTVSGFRVEKTLDTRAMEMRLCDRRWVKTIWFFLQIHGQRPIKEQLIMYLQYVYFILLLS